MRENVALPLLLAAGATWQEATEGPKVNGLLTGLGLTEQADRRPSATSLGEQQRCSVARALVCAPALLLADEPTTHQNEAMIDAVLVALSAAVTAGTCCVVATHSPEVIGRASRVLDLSDSRSL